jgi:predicted patatin/cPLA2 family phospholipase
LAHAVLLILALLAASCGLTSRKDVLAPNLQESLIDPTVTRADYRTTDSQPQLQSKPINVLAISGGGIYGAFDVGVLQGWSDSGTRPVFDVVTGISTGAFIAPFAFLGPKYDGFLKDAYLNLTADQIYRQKPIASGIFSKSLASSKPLKQKIDSAVTQDVLNEIATAHRQGRRLYVGTTNLDTRKLVIWDLGAIAASNKPGSLELFRSIVLASGSVPVFYPPVLLEIDVDGKKYQEMHVDGGTSCAVFVRSFMLNKQLNNLQGQKGSNVYVISSGKLFADPGAVDPNLYDITSNALTSLLYAGTRSDINFIYNLAFEAGMSFHLTAVPNKCTTSGSALSVDPKEMKNLYDNGYQIGLTGKGWLSKPPDEIVKREDLPRSGVELKLKPKP